MKGLNMFFLIMICGISGFGQTMINKTYFKDEFKNEKVKNPKKAKYYEVIHEIGESTYTYELIRIKDEKLIESRIYKNKIPFGVWKYYNKKSKSYTELDYSFDLVYSKEKFTDQIYFDFGKDKVLSTEEAPKKLIPPKVIGEGNPLVCLYKNIKYPKEARENGIMGEVKVHLKVDADGKMSILSIYEGVDPHLDAESVRALKICDNWEPAKLNGEPIEVYSIVLVKYRLE